ncbi:cupin domain-containing protein [Candidatus Bipolaricaulota bacterium]
MAVLVRGKEMKVAEKSVPKGGSLITRLVHGTDMSLMVAERVDEYHSSPHVHQSEQLNYVLEGEIWIFFEHGGFRAVKGDFFRIPGDKIHWSWVKSSGSCTLAESHVPPLTADRADTAVPLLTAQEDASRIPAIANNFVEYEGASVIERRVCDAVNGVSEEEDGTGALIIAARDVPTGMNAVPRGGSVHTKIVYGLDTSLTFATRVDNYHSSPHLHYCEQLNYVIEGEVTFFIEDEGFTATRGDFFRIPTGKVHWFWCRKPGATKLVSTYAPPLVKGREKAIALLTSEEDPSGIGAVDNESVEYGEAVADVERRVCGETA